MKIDCDVPISVLAEITKEQAQALICGIFAGDLLRHFDEPVSGLVKLDYPLTRHDLVDITREKYIGGMLWQIAQKYKTIYETERTTLTRYEPAIPQLLNRGKSNGYYGIWGHDLSDLVFEGIEITKDNIIIHVGS